MRKLLFALLILALPCVSNAGGGATMMMVMGSPPAAGGGGGLLSYDAEGYGDGTNLASAGWTGTDSDEAEIDTAYFHGGAASITVICDTSGPSLTKTFAAQSSTFSASFWLMGTATTAANVYAVELGSGATTAVYLYFQSGNVARVVDGAGAADPEFTFSNGTWFQVEFEIDPATDTYRVKINGTERLIGTTLDFENTVASVDTFKISTYSTSAYTLWIDDITVTAGGW